MKSANRREFLESVGRGMFVAGLGAAVAQDLGFSPAFAYEGATDLSFGKFDGLVDLMQSTPAEKLQPILIEKLSRGETDLTQLISAGALANAETFGGEDYVGFHTAMAMLPALQMSGQLASERQPLPILKVLYRNSQQIQQYGGASKKTLREMHAAEEATVENAGVAIRDACRASDVAKAEQLFGPLGKGSLEDAFNALQPAMQDDINVHRFVFAHRTYGLASLLGSDYAHTILRQCVRFCITHEAGAEEAQQPRIAHSGLDAQAARSVQARRQVARHARSGRRRRRGPGQGRSIKARRNKSADAAAAALADGISPEVVGEAISLASNLMVLRQGADQWRTHGDSAGVHSSDATNAWRNMARIPSPQYAVSGLIVAAYHVAAHKPFSGEAYPTADHRALVKANDAEGLLAEAEDAVRHNDQGPGGRGNCPLWRSGPFARSRVRADAQVHGQRRRPPARREVLPHGARRVHAPRGPLSAGGSLSAWPA